MVIFPRLADVQDTIGRHCLKILSAKTALHGDHKQVEWVLESITSLDEGLKKAQKAFPNANLKVEKEGPKVAVKLRVRL